MNLRYTLMLAVCVSGLAQTTPGSLTGTISDPSAGLIPNATITTVATDGSTQTGLSNAE